MRAIHPRWSLKQRRLRKKSTILAIVCFYRILGILLDLNFVCQWDLTSVTLTLNLSKVPDNVNTETTTRVYASSCEHISVFMNWHLIVIKHILQKCLVSFRSFVNADLLVCRKSKDSGVELISL